jgi:hypothetical protein
METEMFDVSARRVRHAPGLTEHAGPMLLRLGRTYKTSFHRYLCTELDYPIHLMVRAGLLHSPPIHFMILSTLSPTYLRR